LDEELDALQKFYHKQTALTALMSEKATVERRLVWGRLQLQRLKADKKKAGNQKKISSLFKKSEEIRQRLEALDTTISPLAEEFNTLMNKRWGLLMRVGNEKSHFARQVEQYSDIYMSKVSNFLYTTPFAYLRAPHSNLPHDLRKG
ncbi:MAG: HAD family hydrolase, partial [Calditrichaeota bacterium]|nr:HAD family hydrolase [Calditrichota bacterium]